jgi:hypothetical protein
MLDADGGQSLALIYRISSFLPIGFDLNSFHAAAVAGSRVHRNLTDTSNPAKWFMLRSSF